MSSLRHIVADSYSVICGVKEFEHLYFDRCHTSLTSNAAIKLMKEALEIIPLKAILTC